MSSYERKANRLASIPFVALTLVSVAGAIWLPESIPIHYNLRGQPNRWGSPATLLILPVIVFILLSILSATRNAHPDFMNFPGPRTPENVARQRHNTHLMLASMRAFLAFFFLVIQGQSIWAKLYNRDQLSSWTLPCLITMLFVITGYFVWRAYKLVPRQ